MSRDARETRRERALDDLEIVGTETEERFDRIVRLAASRFGAPIALVSLVGGERQWFKARVGLAQQETPVSQAFCVHTIADDAVMVVPDATLDRRFFDHPLVTGPSGIRFYAGAPLILENGLRVGALCVLDHVPRPGFDARDRSDLAAFAAIVVDLMEQRVAMMRHATTELRYRDIVQSAAASVVVVDTDGVILSANPATATIFKRDAEGLHGASVRLLLPDLAATPANDSTAAGVDETMELRGRRADGSDVPVKLHVNRWNDSRGRQFATLVMRDLTARQEAESALAAARRETDAARAAAEQAHLRLEEAVDAMPGGFGLFDADDRLVVCNAAARSLYPTLSHLLTPGASYEELLRTLVDTGVFALAEDEDPEDWIQARLAFRRNPAGHADVQLAGGRWLRFEDRITRDGGRVGIRIDVTASKRREESFKLLFEGNPVPMWLHDPWSGRIVEVNDTAVAAYGYDRETFLAMTVADIERAADPETASPTAGRRHRRADGSVIDVEIVQSRMTFEDRELVLCGLIDVTARNRAEASLRLARDSAEEASRMKSQFLANMSHELRTPLNAILGFSQLLESGVAGPLSENAQSYLGYIGSSGTHLLSIIEDVLDLSRFEAGYLTLDEQEVDLSETIASAVERVRCTAVDRGITIQADLGTAAYRMRGDSFRLKQIVTNLLSNAVKFSLRDGRVLVELAQAPSGEMELRVIDHGIGMHQENVPIALEPFMQIEGGLNRRFEGCGIGLPLTRSLVQLHQGSLTIDSAPRKGTSVCVRFPAERILSTHGIGESAARSPESTTSSRQ